MPGWIRPRIAVVRRRASAWLLLLALGFGPARAAESTMWADLSRPEQGLLAPWAERWPTLAPDQQQRLLGNARAWLKLSPEERAQFHARSGAWEALPPAQRARLRERYEAFQRLPPDEQARLKGEFQRFRQLPQGQRRALREKFERMTPEERRAFLLGARMRDTADIARRAFAFVPPEERPATLDMLRQLGREDRQNLRELVRRLGPGQREELRRELLARPAAERSGWIRQRLGQR